MTGISYASLKPLLASARQEGSQLECLFRCPLSGVEVQASACLVKGRRLEDVSPEEGGALESLRRAFLPLLRSLLRASAPEEEAPGSFSESERQATAVVAFQGVAHHFVLEEGQWVALGEGSGLLSGFVLQLNLAPLILAGDREVAARMLVEVARADGRLTPEEWSFLSAFHSAELGSIDAFMERAALSPEELDAASRSAARDTMLMLAWALALVDREEDLDEEGQLEAFARNLRIPPQRALELKRFAQVHLFEQALARAGRSRRGRKEALALGSRLGLGPLDIRAVEARLLRRRGGGG